MVLKFYASILDAVSSEDQIRENSMEFPLRSSNLKSFTCQVVEFGSFSVLITALLGK